MPTLLCFGDSNTFGSPPLADPTPGARFDAATRWPCVAAATLGPTWTLIEEGLPGRNAQCADPVMGDHMNGQIGLRIALSSHAPIDWLTIMLGTNDLRACLTSDAGVVTAGIAGLLSIATQPEMQDRHQGFKILLIAPPPILEQGPFAADLFGGAAPSAELPARYAPLARAFGAEFLDAGAHITSSPVDGVHFGAEKHGRLGRAVAAALAS